MAHNGVLAYKPLHGFYVPHTPSSVALATVDLHQHWSLQDVSVVPSFLRSVHTPMHRGGVAVKFQTNRLQLRAPPINIGDSRLTRDLLLVGDVIGNCAVYDCATHRQVALRQCHRNESVRYVTGD